MNFLLTNWRYEEFYSDLTDNKRFRSKLKLSDITNEDDMKYYVSKRFKCRIMDDATISALIAFRMAKK